MSEAWKQIPGYENYRVSSTGKVCSDYYISGRWGKTIKRKEPLMLSQDLTHDGYYRVTLSKNKVQKHFSVHRLVALVFIPNPQNLPEVNHKDENTRNNNVENLEWCSRKYNANYGTLPQRESKWNTNHPKKSKTVVKMSLYGEILAEYPSIKEAARKHGIGDECIVRCCKGKQETSAGFKWKYKENHEAD